MVSSEEGETEENNHKTLKEMNVTGGTILAVEDFLQDFKIKVIVMHRDADQFEDEADFEVEGDVPNTSTSDEGEKKKSANGDGQAKGDSPSATKRAASSSSLPALAEKRKRTAEEAGVNLQDDLVCLD